MSVGTFSPFKHHILNVDRVESRLILQDIVSQLWITGRSWLNQTNAISLLSYPLGSILALLSSLRTLVMRR